jgi:geranylgeranyl reductase family protein
VPSSNGIVDEIFDVIVVGAGPAGSAAALAALQSRPGARVALVDAAAFPRDKACGDGIAPQALHVLAELGVPDVAAGFAPVGRLRLRSPLGREVIAEPPEPAYCIPRLVFDARLVDAAVAHGAALIQRRIRTLTQVGGLVELGDGLRAPVVVAADGANSTVRRLLGIAPNPPRASAIAMRGYATGTDGEPEQLIEMVAAGWPAYAWSFPIDGPGHEGRANVGFGMLRTSLAAGGEPGRQALAGPLATLLPDQPADPVSLRAHHLPLSTARPRQPDGRILLAGDAASLINPLTGEGIYYAVLSGQLAGRAAVEPGGAGAGAAYRRALRRELGLHLATTSALYRLARSPEFFDAGLALADRDPAAMDVLVEVGLGRGTLPPRLIARLARRALVIGGRRLLHSEASQVARYGRRIEGPLTGPFSYVRHDFFRHFRHGPRRRVQ